VAGESERARERARESERERERERAREKENERERKRERKRVGGEFARVALAHLLVLQIRGSVPRNRPRRINRILPTTTPISGSEPQFFVASERLIGKLSEAEVDSQLLYINVQWFRGGLVFKAHRRLYHSTLVLRVIKRKKKRAGSNRRVHFHRFALELARSWRPVVQIRRLERAPFWLVVVGVCLEGELGVDEGHDRVEHTPDDPRPPCSVTSVQQLLYINVQRFRGGLVFKAHRLVYHSTLGVRVIKKKKRDTIALSTHPMIRDPPAGFRSWD